MIDIPSSCDPPLLLSTWLLAPRSRLLLSSKSATGYRGVHAVSGTSRYRATYGKPFWLDALLPYRLTQRRW